MFGKRILVLVPHPDDEVVACAAAIWRAQAAGAGIFALYLTHGCIEMNTLWPWQRGKYKDIVARRIEEGEEAARFLEIAPVGWCMRPARHLWRELPKALGEIESAVAENAIDQVWLPAYEGGNPDHDGLNALGQILKKKVGVLEFAEYNFSGGKTNAQSFPFPNGTEQVISLTPYEQEKKREALALYASEKSNLNYVGAEHECYRPLADYDYGKPPHPGTLFYARFQWVPFRHPRVDFTKSAEVSAAITSFLK